MVTLQQIQITISISHIEHAHGPTLHRSWLVAKQHLVDLHRSEVMYLARLQQHVMTTVKSNLHKPFHAVCQCSMLMELVRSISKLMSLKLVQILAMLPSNTCFQSSWLTNVLTLQHPIQLLQIMRLVFSLQHKTLVMTMQQLSVIGVHLEHWLQVPPRLIVKETHMILLIQLHLSIPNTNATTGARIQPTVEPSRFKILPVNSTQRVVIGY
jgi:hypothetical protein